MTPLPEAIQQLIEQWRATADRAEKQRNGRADPYDDRGVELQREAKACRDNAYAPSGRVEQARKEQEVMCQCGESPVTPCPHHPSESSARTPSADHADRDEAYGYLSRLFKQVAPQCEPLPTLVGLAT